MNDAEQDKADPLGLSEEQADTDRRLRQLLGTAIADRYVDFCRLSSGQLPLIVSRPLAGHALRELDSMIRTILTVPLEARSTDNDQQEAMRHDARRMLKKMGFDDAAVQRAGDELKPKLSHRAQIERIISQLGLASDSDIAKLWIGLNETYGRVHQRSFHERLEVDDQFRADYARQFDTVIRAVVVQLQNRYAALMRRTKEIAAMPPAKGIKLFLREIPGAIQLQQYFYENLTEEWLPFLEKEGLLGEPLPDAQIGTVLRLWAWPVGRYLVRMASSNDAEIRRIVASTLRRVRSSTHPDVQHLGLDVVAALPPSEAAELTDIVETWLTPESAPRSASPHKIIAVLAGGGYAEAAIRVTTALFQVSHRDGQAVTFFDPTMYEHYLKGAVSALEEASPILALPAFCDLLLRASRMDKRLAAVQEEDYSYYMVTSLEPARADGGDLFSAIIRGIVRLAEAAVSTEPSVIRRVIAILETYSPRIFRRIAIQSLARVPEEAPDLAEKRLIDEVLIDADWCREEYGKLAKAWFRRIPTERQQDIFGFIESAAENYIDTWRENFEAYHNRRPGPEDDRAFRETTFRDIVWEWRDVLPSDRRTAFDKTVAEFGGRDSWLSRRLQREEPSLNRAAMQQQPVDDTVAHLAKWQPDPNPSAQGRTVPGLALELRESVSGSPQLFSAGAAKFARLRPVFIRHLLDGLRQPTANGTKLDWVPCFDLLDGIVARASRERDISSAPGDDSNWSWTLQSAIEWLAAALRHGTDGIPLIHSERVRSLVLALYRQLKQAPLAEDNRHLDRKHPYFSAIQTGRGAAIDLCVLLVFWLSKDASSRTGQEPREALAHSPDIRSIIESELEDRSPAGWIPRAVLGRYLTWLFFFGEDWLRSHFSTLFPSVSSELAAAAWLGYLQHDKPASDLAELLYPYYAFHIRSLGRDQPPPGYEELGRRLAEYLMVLFLWEKLPNDLLQFFWSAAPVAVRRHAMWFMGREMLPGREYQARAMRYWDQRLQAAIESSDPEPFRRELGTIGNFFLWDLNQVWLLDQLRIMLRAGFLPNDTFGVVDGLAKLVPEHIDKVVEVTNALVRQPNVEAWTFAAQDQSLRRILVEGKKSPTLDTVERVKEIVSFLASRGNPGFLDIDD